MKKKYVSTGIGIFLLVTASVFAQISTDPQNEFYTYAETWELKGYVDHLPQLRPYPLAVVKDILSRVIESGRAADVKIAQDYYEQVTGKPFTLELEGTYTKKRESNRDTNERTETKQYAGGPFAVGDLQLSDLLSFGYSLGMYATNVSDSEVSPMYTNSLYDTVSDPVSVGPFDVNIDINTNVAFAVKNFYIQAGINRSGYGPFLGTDLALNDSSFHAPNLTLAYDGGRWSYTQQISSIGAPLNNGADLDSKSKVDKYFAFHSIRFDVTKKLTVSYYESTIFGQRFDLAYTLPAPFMAVQGMGDSTDNSQMGLLVEYSPVACAKWATNFFADDLDLNNMLKLHFDTKIRVGIQTGVLYSPYGSSCELLGLDYTIITPYTYAHWSYDDDGQTFTDASYNFFNYTNHGVSIGASLPPNSDRINFSARFKPAKRLTLTVKTSFMRHANAYESLDDDEAKNVYLTNYYSHKYGYVYVNYSDGSVIEDGSGNPAFTKVVTSGGDIYSTDGSVWTQQKFVGDDNHVDTAWDYLNLLNQKHCMTIYQTGFDLAYQLPKMKIGLWTLKFGYTWEYIHNDGVQNPIYSGLVGGGDYTAAYDKWVDNLHDTINNYISFSVKIAY